MATQTRWLLVDDIDGSRPATTVEFGLDGESYAVDLSAEHAAELRSVLGEFIAAARARHEERTPALRHAPDPRTTVTAPVASADPPAPPAPHGGLTDVLRDLRAEVRRALFEILTALLDILRRRLDARRVSRGATSAGVGGA
ncbi:Lsr2 dimerization domain-containing protein [Pseudonocardia adelaidensis]|uniref:Lsr2 dimerization domain-containing protein n=1 Tax=Pseudonocardia adelaidensis TaxID=648754 RepID=A0ABP9P104_9PSEU